MENSKIEWTDHTMNPWRGCTKVSPGCQNCYADALSKRNPKVLGEWGPKGVRVVASESKWREPVKWNAKAAKLGVRQRVFCASLADVFEGDDTMPAESREAVHAARARLFELIDDTPNLDWLLLTKRPENIERMLPPRPCTRCFGGQCDSLCPEGKSPRANVWLGTSVENQAAADERIPPLLRVPAAVHFLSVEPLLGLVDLSEWTYTIRVEHNGDGDTQEVSCRPPLDWVIVGGESGHGARPMHPLWAKELKKQCVRSGVPFFFKQWGDYSPYQNEKTRFTPVYSGVSMDSPRAMYHVGKKVAGRVLDGKTWDELPTPRKF